MAGMVANLSDQDMRDLAAYYAGQDGSVLLVLPED
jgi:cytochrome c553